MAESTKQIKDALMQICADIGLGKNNVRLFFDKSLSHTACRHKRKSQ